MLNTDCDALSPCGCSMKRVLCLQPWVSSHNWQRAMNENPILNNILELGTDSNRRQLFPLLYYTTFVVSFDSGSFKFQVQGLLFDFWFIPDSSFQVSISSCREETVEGGLQTTSLSLQWLCNMIGQMFKTCHPNVAVCTKFFDDLSGPSWWILDSHIDFSHLEVRVQENSCHIRI